MKQRKKIWQNSAQKVTGIRSNILTMLQASESLLKHASKVDEPNIEYFTPNHQWSIMLLFDITTPL